MGYRPIRGHILKLENNPHALDFLGDAIIARGYTVTQARTYDEALDAIRDHLPDLIIVVDNLDRGIDARYWLELQHTHPDSRVAMIPLVILAGAAQMEDFKGQAIAGRVVILPLPVNLRTLEETLRALIWPWGKLSSD